MIQATFALPPLSSGPATQIVGRSRSDRIGEGTVEKTRRHANTAALTALELERRQQLIRQRSALQHCQYDGTALEEIRKADAIEARRADAIFGHVLKTGHAGRRPDARGADTRPAVDPWIGVSF
ncbi:MAG: hypothetical protein AAGG72_04830 [Pseudomonadota bacterium]